MGNTMITAIDDYFAKICGKCERLETADCSARLWARGLVDLRGLCLAAGLVEAVKWGHSCFYNGRAEGCAYRRISRGGRGCGLSTGGDQGSESGARY